MSGKNRGDEDERRLLDEQLQDLVGWPWYPDEQQRLGFLKALAQNEDETTTRLVYADWLDERGEHEEADRQRKWPVAREWLVQFCVWNSRYEEISGSFVVRCKPPRKQGGTRRRSHGSLRSSGRWRRLPSSGPVPDASKDSTPTSNHMPAS